MSAITAATRVGVVAVAGDAAGSIAHPSTVGVLSVCLAAYTSVPPRETPSQLCGCVCVYLWWLLSVNRGVAAIQSTPHQLKIEHKYGLLLV